jgi:hypothetical protein
MKFIGLVFDYDTKKMSDNIGRKWAPDAYKNKDFIFKYSTASVASVLHHNPNTEYIIYTDDVDLLDREISKYKVSKKSLVLVDWKDNLQDWKNHKYPFYPLLMLMKNNQLRGKEDYVKLDNDLFCHRPFNLEEMEDDTAYTWKYERIVANGDPRWGEKLICQTVFGTQNIPIFNCGVLGLSKNNHHLVDEVVDVCEQLTNVNILPVTDVGSPIYHCCEQVAYNWIFHSKKIKVMETNYWFDHYFDNKQKCIEASKFLMV